ncbi:hypothetical protein D9M68_1006200 [compost metagenome]
MVVENYKVCYVKIVNTTSLAMHIWAALPADDHREQRECAGGVASPILVPGVLESDREYFRS